MESHFFKYGHCMIHFLKSGHGPKALFAFHGFGQDHQVFGKLARLYGNDYTVYAFDLFFHGKSEWGKNEIPLEKSFWHLLFREFLRQEKIERFSLTGFSMGGKFVLATVEAFPSNIDSVVLVAPDGIKTSFWYSLATYPLILRNLFKSMISKPSRFYAITRFAHSIRLIDKSLMRFVESQMNTEEKRNRVYLSWVVFRHLHFDMSSIAQAINSNKIQLTIVVGSYDKIIAAKSMNRLLHRIEKPKLVILESGHNELLSKWISGANQNDIQC